MRTVGVLLLLASLTPSPSDACATVDHGALSTGVTSEEAIIVFDPATKTQHFIRAASFSTRGSSDFGFIVPTPSLPTFGEVDQGVFAQLAEGYEAARPRQTKLELSSMLVLSRSMKGGDGELRGVTELGTSRVAGMDVTVVRATDSVALGEWLSSHGFSNRPALERWLSHYVERGFFFSAFRYASTGSTLTTSAPRITFTTPTPIYPYLEPDDSLPRFGALRVWLIAPERRAWLDGQSTTDAPTLLTSTSRLAVPAELVSLLPGAKPWVSVFLDSRHVRPRGDVRFEASADGEQLPLPRVKVISVPIEGLFCLLLTLGLVGFGIRRARSSAGVVRS
ncbi:MAG: DUF2330 domain-containing protein [Myxococcales bacterium]|nr:DUF2330 domain-containing protein [Myxococcales bacterium]